MAFDLTGPQMGLLVILAATFWLLFTERLANDLVAVLVILALALTRILTPREALSGFGSEPAIIVAGIFVLAEALQQTGISERVGGWISLVAGRSYRRVVAVLMLAVAGLSVFTHHVTTTAMMIPVTLELARERNIPASKLLIPLSFAASMGTAVTIIGAPAFLVASATLQQAGGPGLRIFSIAPIGLALTLVGTLFMVLFGRRLLPDHEPGLQLGDRSHIDNYFTELLIQPHAPVVGKTLAQLKASGDYRFTVVGWLRDQRPLTVPFGRRRLQAGDVLLIHTTPDDLVTLRHIRGLELHPVEKFRTGKRGAAIHAEGEQIMQAVVAPNAEFIGKSLRTIDFRRRYGAIVIGFWRQGEFLREELAEIPLRAGDVLVLQGNAEALARVERLPAFLLLAPFHNEPRLRHKAPLVALISLGTILVTVLDLVAIDIAMLSGAAAMVLTGCLTLGQAYRAIDKRIYVFIAGAIPLGLAMQQTGTADVLAGLLRHLVEDWPRLLVLLALYAVVGLLTQIMSDAATVALFAPVAVALAQALGAPPTAYVVTVAMAAVTACLTPTGHHGNLLVYGPGRYRFADFVQVGTPFTVLVALVVVLLAAALWGV